MRERGSRQIIFNFEDVYLSGIRRNSESLGNTKRFFQQQRVFGQTNWFSLHYYESNRSILAGIRYFFLFLAVFYVEDFKSLAEICQMQKRDMRVNI